MGSAIFLTTVPAMIITSACLGLARGMTPDVARREAVWNAFRAELVGSMVASIAYGSLTVTNFRGFNQFGLIGFVGIFVAIVGFMNLTMAWMKGTQPDFSAWPVIIIGGAMWLQSVPIMRAAEKEERRERLRELFNKKDKR